MLTLYSKSPHTNNNSHFNTAALLRYVIFSHNIVTFEDVVKHGGLTFLSILLCLFLCTVLLC